MSDPNHWWIYRSPADSPRTIRDLPAPPPWRRFDRAERERIDLAFQADREEIELVNASLYLRRPLLITGPPGSGKSSLARSVARELGLGEVLVWPINSRSTLADALYRYDAIGRLNQAAYRRGPPPAAEGAPAEDEAEEWRDIGSYIRLGPLGTALLGGEQLDDTGRRAPRVLLIDEFDKSEIDLPNDLLHIFEEGWFEIPELARLPERAGQIHVATWDAGQVLVERGRVPARAFPFVVITSNGERAFPPAFLRRCLRLEMEAPDEAKLRRIVEAHLGPAAVEQADLLIREFVRRRDVERRDLATDQLLNAVYLVLQHVGLLGDAPGSKERWQLADAILRELSDV